MLIEGGDTDTNAAIVGSMIGALVGYTGLPTAYIDKILSFENKDRDGNFNTRNPRDTYLIPKYHVCNLLV
jgi:ADP-ribosylglycohydrolase